LRKISVFKIYRWSFKTALLIAIGITTSADTPLTKTDPTLAQSESTLTVTAAGTQTNTATPVIFNASISAKPGDVIGLQGHFSSSTQVWLSIGASAKIRLPAINQMAGYVSVQIPTNQPWGQYSVQVYDQNSYSKPIYINQALGMSFDTPEVAPSSTFRIFGRNLLLPEAKPTVRFVNSLTGESLNATVTLAGSDAYILKVTAPAKLTPGVKYDIYVSNGYSSTSGETKIDQSLLSRTGGVDYFKLGVPWAGDYNFYKNVYNVKTDPRLSIHAVGDGINNDQPAIQNAIKIAKAAGGGVVYLPKGTYKLASAGLGMVSKVVLQGESKDLTTIQYGFSTMPEKSYAIWWSTGTSVAGIADLTIQNVNDSSRQYSSMANGKNTSELFMQRIRFDLKSADSIYWTNTTKMVVANSIFIQAPNNLNHGPWVFNGSSNFVIRGNKSSHSIGGYSINNVRDGVIESNHFIRNATYQIPETRNLNINFGTNISILNNTFDVINGPLTDKINDGETILSEGGGAKRQNEDIGTVTGATSQTIQDTSKTFPAFSSQAVVVIVSGTGSGQWRKITSVSGNTLTVDRPWEVIPTVGSRYATMSWSAANWLLKGNTLKNNSQGILLYSGSSRDVAIVGNQLINSRGIYLRPDQRLDRRQFSIIYNTQVINNKLTNTDGRRPAFIGVRSAQVNGDSTFGIGALGIEIRNNSVTAYSPNTIEPPGTERFTECYYNALMYQSSSSYRDLGVPSILGTIFQGNQAINCNNAYYLNSGSFQTILWNTILNRVGSLKQDTSINGVTHSSVGTTISP
jgi:hypothetical protein